jgi:hypothetical protein
MKFLLTRELGRLATWLRILGIDARCERSVHKGIVMMGALKEDRAVITRNHRFGTRHGGTVLLMKAEELEDQLKEFMQITGLRPSRQELFSRCTVCNEPLAAVAKAEVEAAVPAYVYETVEDFRKCPKCGRVYWRGTHWGNVEDVLKKLGLADVGESNP